MPEYSNPTTPTLTQKTHIILWTPTCHKRTRRDIKKERKSVWEKKRKARRCVHKRRWNWQQFSVPCVHRKVLRRCYFFCCCVSLCMYVYIIFTLYVFRIKVEETDWERKTTNKSVCLTVMYILLVSFLRSHSLSPFFEILYVRCADDGGKKGSTMEYYGTWYFFSLISAAEKTNCFCKHDNIHVRYGPAVIYIHIM